jgi:ubiquinone/menaquinone biosynthesis C-methylase UbiE
MRPLLFLSVFHLCYGFTSICVQRKSTLLYSNGSNENEEVSRRDFGGLIVGAIGAVGYVKLASSAIKQITRGEGVYPMEHEDIVSAVFRRAIVEAAKETPSDKPFRVLEVGIGPDCRTIMRGIYNDAFQDCNRNVHLYGVDIDPPSEESIARAREKISVSNPDVELTAEKGDVVQGLSYPNGFFDVITCSLVLCSVTDQAKSLREIKRMLKSTGGTFGYVEHVAVDLEKDTEKNRVFFEWQQRTLDLLQQAVAHNCHLHRNTEKEIQSVFHDADVLESQRFFIKDMWPISCQCSGVIKTK